MSKKDKDNADPPFGVDFVTETVCKARHETVEAKLDGVKNSIYLSAATMTVVITLVQLALTLLRR